MLLMGPTSLIPIRDDNPTTTLAVVSIGIIALNVLAFLSEPGLGTGNSCELQQFFYKWGVVPREIVEGSQLVGSLGPGCPLLRKSIYLSLLTSMFLHGGFLHIGGNMLFLWVFGNNIEDTIGKIRYVAFYLLAGVLATLAHVYANSGSTVPTVGASGAVAGLLGAYIVLYPRAQVTTMVPIFFFLHFMRLPAMVVLGIWFASQFLIGSGQQAGGAGVAWMAHVGGFAAGMLLIFVFGGWKRRRRPRLDWEPIR